MRKLFKGRSTERDAFHIPRSVQQSIPIKRIYKDGIFRVSGRFSKTWRFFDINYAVASPEKQMELFLSYCGVLNSLPIDAGIKLTLVNRQLNRQEFSRNLLMAATICAASTTAFCWTRPAAATIWCRRSTSPCPLPSTVSRRPAPSSPAWELT